MNMEESKKTDTVEPKWRQIVIETDGNEIRLKMAEVSGKIELIAILQTVVDFINKPVKKQNGN